MGKFSVNSEIGKLNTVLIHEPGDELLHLTPDWLDDLLFDDIPWLEKAKEEHQAFQQTLKNEGVEVIELIDLVVDSLYNENIKENFLNEFLYESKVIDEKLQRKIKKYLLSLPLKTMVSKTMAGILKSDLKSYPKTRLKDYIKTYPFITDPMPNLYFTRDPFTIIHQTISIHNMYKNARKRESLYAKYIYTYHKRFQHLKQSYSRDELYALEGGDILNINNKLLLIGISERTESEAIEKLAINLFDKTNINLVLAVILPKKRTFMHLDTVLTQVDIDKFLIHPDFLKELNIYQLNRSTKGIKIKENKKTLKQSLSEHLSLKVKMIACGGTNLLSADREQWNDGANVFAVKPGVVIAYERNDLTNKKLEQHGIKVIRIPSSELSRGRGGPRCMTMPLDRDIFK